MKTLVHRMIVLAALGLGFQPATGQANGCNVYAFGDSLSDIGAASPYSSFSQSGGLEPPSRAPATAPNPGVPIVPPEGFYAEGRFADGSIWTQNFAAAVCPGGTLVSFARGGAYSDDRNAGEDLGVSGGLRTQVFEDLDDALGPGGSFGANDIATVWAFANNVVFELLSARPVRAVQDVTAAVRQLAARGARRILVVNTPDIGATPYGQFLSQQAFPGLPNALNARVTQFNNMLRIAVQGLDRTLDASVRLLDVNTAVRALLTDPGAFGFANAAVPCMVQDELRIRVLTGACPVVPRADGSLALDATGTVFYDLLHPTRAVHLLIAMAAQGAIGPAPAPAVASASQD